MADNWNSSSPKGGPMVDVPWLGACVIGPRIGKNGYARVASGKRGVWLYAHRVAWELVHGPIPRGMHLHHICHTPACVNVEHLDLLTPQQHRARHRTCDHGDEYRSPHGTGTRCRVCERERFKQRLRTDPAFRERRNARRRKGVSLG